MVSSEAGEKGRMSALDKSLNKTAREMDYTEDHTLRPFHDAF